MEAGKLSIQDDVVNRRVVASHGVGLRRPRTKPGAHCSIEEAPAVPISFVSTKPAAQVPSNLPTNAIKFTWHG